MDGGMSKKGKSSRVRHGYCKLTGAPGPFVKSHIIPEALTQMSEKGRALVQYGVGNRPVRRWSSWYDPALVIRAGEDVLADLDTWAIRVLRAEKMVWSGWDGMASLGECHEKIDEHFGIRSVDVDTQRLRLFFLSILWRAAATQLPEFFEISLPHDDLEMLRRGLVEGVALPIDFYPIQLTQLSTKGVMHNQAPRMDVKVMPDLEGGADYPLSFYRFYFDGLIAHFTMPHQRGPSPKEMGKLCVGAADTVVLSTVTFEESAQQVEIRAILEDYRQKFGSYP